MTQDLRRMLTAEVKTHESNLSKWRPELASVERKGEHAAQEADAEQRSSGRAWGHISGSATARWVALSATVSACNGRARELSGMVRDAEQRLACVNRLLSADPEAARRVVVERRGDVVAIHKKIDTNSKAGARWEALASDYFGQAEAARATQTAIARHSLPDDVRAELGIVGDPPAPPPIDPATLEQRAVGYAEAAELCKRQGEQLLCDLDAARQAEADSVAELLAQRAIEAELEHAEALAKYVQALVKFDASHHAAYDLAPTLPDLRRMVSESRAEALEAALAAVVPARAEAGLMNRVRRVVGLA